MKKRPKQFRIAPKIKWRTLEDCPIGPFISEYGNLCFKTEYQAADGRIEAYVAGSGEMFWGGTISAKDQRGVYVMPCTMIVDR
jgi:hypothetical protein